MEVELRSLIAASAPDARLPSVRSLMARHRASPVTVQRIVDRLVREGRVVSRPGSGVYVASRAALGRIDTAGQAPALGDAPWRDVVARVFRPPPPGAIDLASGYGDAELEPTALLRQAFGRASRRSGVYGRTELAGNPELRAWFATASGLPYSPRNVLVAPGGQAALSTVIRALVRPGGALVVETPTYFGVIAIARAAGIRLVPLPTDAHGLRTDLLDRVPRDPPPRAVYVQPCWANPTGSVLAPERREALVAWARRVGAFVIEDDYARDLDLDPAGRPPLPLAAEAPDCVIYLRTLTKLIAASVRVCAVAAHGPVLDRLAAAAGVDHWFTSGIVQEAALELVRSRGWPAHVARVQRILRARRDAAVERLCEVGLPPATEPRGGYSLWVPLPVPEDVLLPALTRDGVQVTAGSVYHAAEPDGPSLRISLAGADVPTLLDGIDRLGRALGRVGAA
ncbi:MAG: PLP-dependent aminotransferase family protein [Myxococcota bacterium]